MNKTVALTMLALAAASLGENVYDVRDERQNCKKRILSKEEKEKIQRDYKNTLHAYNINGEIIEAPNKKTARKIYNNRKR